MAAVTASLALSKPAPRAASAPRVRVRPPRRLRSLSARLQANLLPMAMAMQPLHRLRRLLRAPRQPTTTTTASSLHAPRGMVPSIWERNPNTVLRGGRPPPHAMASYGRCRLEAVAVEVEEVVMGGVRSRRSSAVSAAWRRRRRRQAAKGPPRREGSYTDKHRGGRRCRWVATRGEAQIGVVMRPLYQIALGQLDAFGGGARAREREKDEGVRAVMDRICCRVLLMCVCIGLCTERETCVKGARDQRCEMLLTNLSGVTERAPSVCRLYGRTRHKCRPPRRPSTRPAPSIRSPTGRPPPLSTAIQHRAFIIRPRLPPCLIPAKEGEFDLVAKPAKSRKFVRDRQAGRRIKDHRRARFAAWRVFVQSAWPRRLR